MAVIEAAQRLRVIFGSTSLLSCLSPWPACYNAAVKSHLLNSYRCAEEARHKALISPYLHLRSLAPRNATHCYFFAEGGESSHHSLVFLFLARLCCSGDYSVTGRRCTRAVSNFAWQLHEYDAKSDCKTRRLIRSLLPLLLFGTISILCLQLHTYLHTNIHIRT